MSNCKTTLRQLLSEELLRVCQAANASLSTKTLNPKFSKATINNTREAIKTMWTDNNTINRMMGIFAALLDAPELREGYGVIFKMFSVIILKKDTTSHRYGVDKPRIVLHADRRTCLGEDGAYATTFSDADKPQLATDEQIVECINTLTDAQWKTITTDPLFAPLMGIILDKELQVAKPRKPRKPKQVQMDEPSLETIADPKAA